MASTWGLSWGSNWAVSWEARVAPPIVVSAGTGGGGGVLRPLSSRSRKYDQERRRIELEKLELLLEQVWAKLHPPEPETPKEIVPVAQIIPSIDWDAATRLKTEFEAARENLIRVTAQLEAALVAQQVERQRRAAEIEQDEEDDALALLLAA